jgi:hypothetical protein
VLYKGYLLNNRRLQKLTGLALGKFFGMLLFLG